MSQLTERTDFNIIRYANCWEDADVLLQALQLKEGSSVLSVGSAGDNSFSLLSTNPELLMAVDLSEAQLFLIELKRAAIEAMDRDDFLAFIGITDSDKRKENFKLIKGKMPVNAISYWEKNINIIEQGLIFGGKFERYFQFFNKWLLPLVHSRKTRIELFRKKSEKEHRVFYNSVWNSYRWRLLFRIFFSKKVMGKYGRDPEFLNEVNVPVHKFIFNKAEKHLLSVRSQNNYFLKMIMLGVFGEPLPHYLREENYMKVKGNLQQLKTFNGYAEAAIKMMPKVDGCNLSDIFEYMPDEVFKNTAKTLALQTPVGCRMAYWNLMVPRRLSKAIPDKYEYNPILSQQLTETDLGFFYNRIHIDVRL